MPAGNIPYLSVAEATQLQFKLVDCIHRHFPNAAFLRTGDLGLAENGRPTQTAAVEATLASFFGAEDCALVRGAGTGAIRLGLESLVKAGDTVLVHAAPIYPSTQASLDSLGVELNRVDFNRPELFRWELAERRPKLALIQHARQLLRDDYDIAELIAEAKRQGCPVLVDDNYAVLKDPVDGIAAGADISAFSMFKLLGPPGIGCVLGRKDLMDSIRAKLCTGGTQVQGFEAMDALRSLVAAPVLMAIQAAEIDKIYAEIKKLICRPERYLIKDVFVASMQSRVLMVEFTEPIAPRVMEHAAALGASPYPVGAESRYEAPALFYKASRTFLADEPRAMDYFLRINPMRSGCETVMRILTEAIEAIRREGYGCS